MKNKQNNTVTQYRNKIIHNKTTTVINTGRTQKNT